MQRALSYGETFDFLTPRIVTEETKSPLFLRKPTVLAQQLCILDQKQFFQIEVHELKDQSWNSGDNSFDVAPNTTRCIEYFNRVSYWCATEIVSQKSLKMRVKVLKRILVIAQVSVAHCLVARTNKNCRNAWSTKTTTLSSLSLVPSVSLLYLDLK